MARRLILKCLPAAAALGLLATPAFAGGVVAALDADPPRAMAGSPFTVGFTVISMHDGQPQSDVEPEVTATNPATGEVVNVVAKSDGTAGHFVATLRLPSAGQWNWEIQPYRKMIENYPPSVFTPILASAPGAAAEPAPQPGPAAQAVASWLPLAAIGALAALVTLAWAFTRRRRAMA